MPFLIILLFVVFYIKVRHSPSSSNRKPPFYLHSFLQIDDITSFSLLNVDKEFIDKMRAARERDLREYEEQIKGKFDDQPKE